MLRDGVNPVCVMCCSVSCCLCVLFLAACLPVGSLDRQTGRQADRQTGRQADGLRFSLSPSCARALSLYVCVSLFLALFATFFFKKLKKSDFFNSVFWFLTFNVPVGV